ncbi:MAG: alanine racemase [Caldiserica bacterium]|nr:alanine racemase [Caldisericota bacterium]
MMTWVEINLSTIRENFRRVRNAIGKRKILVTVKADAYGHGIHQVSRVLEEEGVDFLGIARWEEGAELREKGIKKPLLLLCPFLPEDADKLLRYNITPSLTSVELLPCLIKEARKRNRKIPVHINVDTGMGRAGINPEEAEKISQEITNSSNLILEGIYTHFPSADTDKEFTRRQINSFNTLINNLCSKGIHIPIRHAANSAGILNFPDSFLDMVRPGIIIYGYYPSSQVSKSIEIMPSLYWKTKVLQIRKVEKGTSVSYGRTYFTGKTCKILTLGIGYGDGYSRCLSNQGKVILGGRKYPVVGRVCMDEVMVEVDENTPVKIGDEVMVIGKEGKAEIKVEEVAEKTGTIPHEVVSTIGKRVERIYKNAE